MAATIESLTVALDRVWTQRRFEDQLYSETPFLDKLKKTDRYTVGETARVPLHTRRNGGFTSLPEGGGTLNEAGQQGYNKAEFKYKHFHQQVAVQGEAIDVTDGDAIVRAVDEEISGALTDMNRQLTRMLFMDGTGRICKCRTSSSNNVDLNTTEGAQALERGWLFIGQPVDVGSATEEALRVNGSKITALDETNVAFTVASGNVTNEATTDYVSQKDARAGETSYEMNGLKNIYNTTELGGLTSSSEPLWKATLNEESIPLTIGALLAAQQKIRQKRGKNPNFLLTGLKQQRKFYEQLQQQVNFSSDKGLTAGSDETATWNGMDIVADPDCWDAELYLGSYDHLFIVAVDKPYWQNKVTGGAQLAWIQGTDSYGGKLSYRMNLGANRRNDGYRFTALT